MGLTQRVYELKRKRRRDARDCAGEAGSRDVGFREAHRRIREPQPPQGKVPGAHELVAEFHVNRVHAAFVNLEA